MDVRRQRAAGSELAHGEAGEHRPVPVVDQAALRIGAAVPVVQRRRYERLLLEHSEIVHDNRRYEGLYTRTWRRMSSRLQDEIEIHGVKGRIQSEAARRLVALVVPEKLADERALHREHRIRFEIRILLVEDVRRDRFVAVG